ncbi:MAG: hypothetical protein ABI240_12480 [Sphingomonas sp.]
MPLASVHKLTTGGSSLAALEQRERLEEVSRLYALETEAVSDAQLDSLTDEAIKTLKLQDATFWQRVKFRSRMIRAAAGGDEDKKARKVR